MLGPCNREETAMADPQAALMTQLRNIQGKTGQTIAELHAALAGSGLAKHGEKRSWLIERYGLGYGDANTVVALVGKIPPGLDGAPAAAGAPAAGDPLEAIYSGAKAHLRPLHETTIAAIEAFGPFEQAPKKTYISLRRKKQFAMLGPATKEQLELGLNAKGLPEHPRLKPLPAGGMCQYTVRLSSAGEVDATLLAWVRQAYDAAG
jgi:hypothetical protein